MPVTRSELTFPLPLTNLRRWLTRTVVLVLTVSYLFNSYLCLVTQMPILCCINVLLTSCLPSSEPVTLLMWISIFSMALAHVATGIVVPHQKYIIYILSDLLQILRITLNSPVFSKQKGFIDSINLASENTDSFLFFLIYFTNQSQFPLPSLSPLSHSFPHLPSIPPSIPPLSPFRRGKTSPENQEGMA